MPKELHFLNVVGMWNGTGPGLVRDLVPDRRSRTAGPGPLVRDWILGRARGSSRIFQKIRFPKSSWGPGPDRSGPGPGPDARMPKEVDFVKVHGVSGLEWVGAGPGPGPGPLVLDRLSWIVGPGLGFRAC